MLGLPSGPLGLDGIGGEHEDDGVGLADQRGDPFPPILELFDIAAIDQRLYAAFPQATLQPIDEGEILPRV
jgi:hypothetical protein